MHYSSKIWLLFLVLFGLSACFRKTTCPAYQSQYILDEEVFKERYSLFESDSIPKPDIGYVKKSKFRIHVEKPYWKKYGEIKDVEMVTIYPEVEDSLLLASNVTDSLYADSLGVRPSPYMTTFNYDQLIYNTLFGRMLEPERDTDEEMREDLEVEDQDSTATGEEKAGFFKRLFRKKDKQREEGDVDEVIDDEEENPLPEEESPAEEPNETEPEEDDGF